MRIIPIPEIYVGSTALNEVLPFLDRLSAEKLLVVTDKGIVKAGIYENLENILSTAGKTIILFDGVQPDPSITLVSEVTDLARKADIDAVIGIGGGSSIDSAKVAAASIGNEGDIDKYIGIDQLKKDSIPMIAIPTTAGTGSEVTPIAILSDEKEHLKKGIVSNKIIPKCAILDPTLTVGMPQHITAFTGMDALTHAIEAYTSVNASDYSDPLALRAVTLISNNIRKAYKNGTDIKAREAMLKGSLLAGIAFANAGVTAVHAFAYPLGGTYHIPHGLANSVMLPVVMEYNMVGSEDKFTDLARCMLDKEDVNAQSAVAFVNKLSSDLNIPRNLAELEIPGEVISDLAEGAMKVTRLLANNPRKIELEDAKKIYTAAYKR
ncbi:MAG: iron-containing alcohol dehydrogenase [Deltaproteobacteria bacterium]|nr:iron-containing alcohol dehydrogenase [Deltaproteobacteria bacterium]